MHIFVTQVLNYLHCYVTNMYLLATWKCMAMFVHTAVVENLIMLFNGILDTMCHLVIQISAYWNFSWWE